MKKTGFLKNLSHFFIIFFSLFTLCSFSNYKLDVFGAIQQGDIERVRALGNADTVELRDVYGNTLLHIVVQEPCTDGIKEIIGEFIGAGIKVDARNNALQTPLHKAAWSGCIEAVEALIDHDANVEAEDMFGSRPAHEAARKGHIEILYALDNADADLSAQDNYGNSPAHWLVWNEHIEGIQVLKAVKADLNITNDNGDSPFLIAFNKRDEEMTLGLVEAGVIIEEKRTDSWLNSILGDGLLDFASEH